jgi:hypothetical protein
VRSRGQFVAKTVLGHLQNLAKAFHDPRWGVHHRDYFEMLQRDSSVFSGDFPSWLRSYAVYQFASSPHTVADPLVYRGGALRYTPRVDQTAQSWQPVLNYAQDLARRYGLLRASLTEEQQLSLEQQRTLTQHQQKLHAAEARNRSLEHELDSAEARSRSLEQASDAVETRSRSLEQEVSAAYRRWLAEAQHVDRHLRSTWTWTVGRIALWPARQLRRGWRGSRRAVAGFGGRR